MATDSELQEAVSRVRRSQTPHSMRPLPSFVGHRKSEMHLFFLPTRSMLPAWMVSSAVSAPMLRAVVSGWLLGFVWAKGERDEAAYEVAQQAIREVLGVFESQASGPWLVGDSLTAAGIGFRKSGHRRRLRSASHLRFNV
jgi:hypothetical protein